MTGDVAKPRVRERPIGRMYTPRGTLIRFGVDNGDVSIIFATKDSNAQEALLDPEHVEEFWRLFLAAKLAAPDSAVRCLLILSPSGNLLLAEQAKPSRAERWGSPMTTHARPGYDR